ncbi:N-6 DNA methylase, partial [Micromonospora sp. ATA32]|nr:N-6 DNA methylase [Micromonospora sp. ATA32]
MATLNAAVHELRCDLSAEPPALAHANEVDAGPGGYDVVLLNPPFGKTEWEPAPGAEREWLCGRPAAYDTASAWLQTVVAALAPGGRAAVVMPYRVASHLSDQQRPVREGMVEHGVVRCVITLPRNLFRETANPVTVWILTHPNRSAARGHPADRRPAGDAGQRQLPGADRGGLRRHPPHLPTLAARLDSVAPGHIPINRGRGNPGPGPATMTTPSSPTPTWRHHHVRRDDRLPGQRTPTDPSDRTGPIEDWLDHPPGRRAETTKDSLIGVVSDDWWVGNLDQRCDIQPGPSGTLLAKSDYVHDGIPLVMAGDICDGGIAPDPKAQVSRQTAERLKDYRLQSGDILLVRIGETTRFGIVTAQADGWLMGNTCIRLRPHPQVTPAFLAHYLG